MEKYKELGLDELHKMDKIIILSFMVGVALAMFYSFYNEEIVLGIVFMSTLIVVGTSKRYKVFNN